MFLKKWLREMGIYVLSVYLPAAVVLAFGTAAVTWWEEYAWGSTVLFGIFVFIITLYLIRKRK